MNKFFLAIMFLFLAKTFFGQEQDSILFNKNAVYGELLGNAGIGSYSLNYERVISINNRGFLTIRVGMSALPYRAFFLPILINTVFGKNKKNHFELGGGMTFSMYINSKKKIEFNEYDYAVTANLMYRYQNPKGKFIFRAGWTPLVYYNWFDRGGIGTIGGVIMLFDFGTSIGFLF